MKILLTENEIDALDFSYTGTFKTSKAIDMHVKNVVAKAQLRRVVEWLKERNNCPVIHGGKAFTLMLKDWQALLKEAETP